MFRHVIAMAKELGIECIAEGVETPYQLRVLHENGCDLAQGFLYDKPLPYKDFLKRRFGKVWVPYAIAVLLWGLWYLIAKGYFPLSEVASHLLLYKMFSTELDTSLCYPYWFISTIVQLYLFWPLIVRAYRMRWGGRILLIISLLWSTIVGLLGLEEERPWGSFFLQYLWEFGLGMWIAERCMKDDGRNKMLMDVSAYKWWWLIIGAIGVMGLSAFMAWNGGILI
jgi:peptidoglycan/LPS O-acetylase OafA/YrhL